MPRRVARVKKEESPTYVSFNVDESTYQIDPRRQKVYRRFVEVETSKAFEIYSMWRSRTLSV